MKERIEKIKQYFRGFEISDGIAFISVVFPKKWQIPNPEILKEMFNVKTVASEEKNGTYFFTEIDNGVLTVFDAVDFTVEFNVNIEKKSQLLMEKVEELKNIFAEKPIEVLRTIQFKYIEKQPRKNKKNKEKEIVSEIKDETNYETVSVSNEINNDTVEDDSLLDYAKELTE